MILVERKFAGSELEEFLDGESTADPNAKFDERWFIDRKANESRDVTFGGSRI